MMGFFMAARKLNTPGAKEPEQTTQEQADQALEEILNDASEGALVPDEQFDAVAQELAEAKKELAELKRKQQSIKAPAQSVESKNELRNPRMKLTDAGWTAAED